MESKNIIRNADGILLCVGFATFLFHLESLLVGPFWADFVRTIQMRILALVGRISIWLFVRWIGWVSPFSKTAWSPDDDSLASSQVDQFLRCF